MFPTSVKFANQQLMHLCVGQVAVTVTFVPFKVALDGTHVEPCESRPLKSVLVTSSLQGVYPHLLRPFRCVRVIATQHK